MICTIPGRSRTWTLPKPSSGSPMLRRSAHRRVPRRTWQYSSEPASPARASHATCAVPAASTATPGSCPRPRKPGAAAAGAAPSRTASSERRAVLSNGIGGSYASNSRAGAGSLSWRSQQTHDVSWIRRHPTQRDPYAIPAIWATAGVGRASSPGHFFLPRWQAATGFYLLLRTRATRGWAARTTRAGKPRQSPTIFRISAFRRLLKPPSRSHISMHRPCRLTHRRRCRARGTVPTGR